MSVYRGEKRGKQALSQEFEDRGCELHEHCLPFCPEPVCIEDMGWMERFRYLKLKGVENKRKVLR